MRKHRLFLVLVALAVLVAVLAVVLRPAPEPEYGGKKLSEWVERLVRHSWEGPDVEAEEAVRQIGTNAIPFLLQWIQYEPPAWKSTLYVAIDKVRRWPRFTSAHGDKQFHRRYASVYAFKVLGAGATAAVPTLSKVLNDHKQWLSSVNAVRALAYIGKDAQPALVAGLTNQEKQIRSLAALYMQLNASKAQPRLLDMVILLNDPNPVARDGYIEFLLSLDPEALKTNGVLPKRPEQTE